MGEFFAEKKYRDEMPYLVNTEEKEWCLFFANGKLAGFYAHEERERHTAISGVYVLPAFRQYGVGTFMLEDMLRSFPTVRMVTSSPRPVSYTHLALSKKVPVLVLDRMISGLEGQIDNILIDNASIARRAVQLSLIHIYSPRDPIRYSGRRSSAASVSARNS